LFIARAKDGAKDLTYILEKNGVAFDDVAIYEKTRESAGMITENNVDLVAFTSSSAVEAFVESAANMDFSKMKAVCIGERTAVTAKSFGMTVFVSAESTIESMIDIIKRLL